MTTSRQESNQMKDSNPTAKLAEAMRRAKPSQSGLEQWVATRLFAELSPPKREPGPTAQDEYGRFVTLYQGPLDLIALARAAARAVQDAQAAAQRRQENPGRTTIVPGDRL